MCHLVAMLDYQESVTTEQTDRQTLDKVIPMCRYALQATQKVSGEPLIPTLNPLMDVRARIAAYVCRTLLLSG